MSHSFAALLPHLSFRQPHQHTQALWFTIHTYPAFMSGTYRGMLHGIVLRDYPEQVLSLAKAKSVLANMRELLSWAHGQCRIDVTASTVERKIGGLAFAGSCPGGCEDFSPKGSHAHFIRLTCKIGCSVQMEEQSTTTRHRFSSTHGSQGKPRTHAEDILCRLWNLH